MNTPPPLMRDQRVADREHLNLLAIFPFLVAGLAIVVLLRESVAELYQSNPP